MGKWTEQNFFKEISQNVQKTHEDIFNIPDHKENAMEFYSVTKKNEILSLQVNGTGENHLMWVSQV
jgi:hypothetical protein